MIKYLTIFLLYLVIIVSCSIIKPLSILMTSQRNLEDFQFTAISTGTWSTNDFFDETFENS